MIWTQYEDKRWGFPLVGPLEKIINDHKPLSGKREPSHLK